MESFAFRRRGYLLAASLLILAACSSRALEVSPSAAVVVASTVDDAFACPIAPVAATPPSDRLVDVTVGHEDGFDRVTFVFEPSVAPPAVIPGLMVLKADVPPWRGEDGKPLKIAGEKYIEVRFRNMAVSGTDGTAVYRGSTELAPRLTAVREVIRIGSDRGVLDWIVGVDGSGCARTRLLPDELRVIVDVRND